MFAQHCWIISWWFSEMMCSILKYRIAVQNTKEASEVRRLSLLKNECIYTHIGFFNCFAFFNWFYPFPLALDIRTSLSFRKAIMWKEYAVYKTVTCLEARRCCRSDGTAAKSTCYQCIKPQFLYLQQQNNNCKIEGYNIIDMICKLMFNHCNALEDLGEG